MTYARMLRFALVGCVFAAGGLAVDGQAANATKIGKLYVFGDSYSDTGAFVPLDNPGGTTWAGYLAQDFNITLTTSKNADPGTDGVNFAESGARVDPIPAPTRASDSQVESRGIPAGRRM